MPGKSKKGGGLQSSPVYKKQKFGTAKSPFTMKGSPYKQSQPTAVAIHPFVNKPYGTDPNAPQHNLKNLRTPKNWPGMMGSSVNMPQKNIVRPDPQRSLQALLKEIRA